MAGRAVANSRGIYGVYRITLDQDWNIKDLDVRCMDYYHDPSLRVLINLKTGLLWTKVLRLCGLFRPGTATGKKMLFMKYAYLRLARIRAHGALNNGTGMEK